RPPARSPLLPAPGRSGARHRAPAHSDRDGRVHHGVPPRTAQRHRAPEADRRHPRRPGQGPARPRLGRRAAPRRHHLSHVPRRARRIRRSTESCLKGAGRRVYSSRAPPPGATSDPPRETMASALTLHKTTIGKKAAVAITGLILFGFVIGHLA